MNAMRIGRHLGVLGCMAMFSLLILSVSAQNTTVNPATGTTIQTLPQPTPYQVINQGANNRVWERTVYEPGPGGKAIPKKHRYTELATGLNYLQNGQWAASKEEIDALPQGGAAATRGEHQVYFPGDIYQGVIEVVTPDGEQLQSRPMGLSYFDGTNSVLIAELTNSVGQLVSSNQIIYPNAFTDVGADLLYTYTKAGIEQDIVLRQQPPPPEAYGLNPQTTRLQVLTEFFDAPEPAKTGTAASPSDGLQDTTLKFGATVMNQGKAFVIGDAAPTTQGKNQIPVYKTWEHLEGRTFLVEEVPFWRIGPSLQSLPLPASSSAVSLNAVLHKVSTSRLLTPSRLVQKAGTNTVQLAKADLNQRRGVVLDYAEVDTDQTNFTFQSDTTYLVDGAFNAYGTTTLEGGTVVKFDFNGEIEIDANGTIDCQTAPYRPAVFTSINDDSVGLSGAYSGDPYYNGSPQISDVNGFLKINATNALLHDVRFSYSELGMVQGNYGDISSQLDVWNCQFQDVDVAVYAYDIGLHNVLIARSNDSDAAVFVEGPSLIAENVTADRGNSFMEVAYHGGTVALTNCLVTGQPLGDAPGYPGNLLTNSTFFLPSPASPVYQTVGAGSYYLTNGSPYHNVGTTNISPDLLADLQTKTTYPPIVYSNTTISVATTFSPHVQRDTNAAPDLGYHYDPLDYVFSGVEAQSNITFTAGTAVGWFDITTSPGYGIIIDQDAIVSFNGTAADPCWMARYDTVQEGGNGNWTAVGWGFALTANNSNSGYSPDAPQVVAQFTKFSSRNFNDLAFRDYIGYFIESASDCEFWGAIAGGYDVSLYCTNCLFFRSPPGIEDDQPNTSLVMQNCTVVGMDMNGFNITHDNGSTWPVSITDCAFDGVAIHADAAGLVCDYNSFLTNADRLPISGAHDVILTTSYNWQSSWFGDFYLPTTSLLINAGDVTADTIGLYHFTTQTNQVPETNSIVDIGYHYVATDAYGNPLDSNGDGIPDYLEDANGNGLWDNGETNWALAILVQPTNQAVTEGNNATFTVTAVGTPQLSYQWRFNGANLLGATNATLAINDALPANAGNYTVVVSNFVGSITSMTATLTVSLPSYTVLYGSLTNFTFQGDTTYFVNSTVQLYGTTTIEGGTVVKFFNQPAAGLLLIGPLTCLTGPYRPAILTSKDDNSVGQTIAGSTGQPTNVATAIFLTGGIGQTNAYKHLRILYAGTGISSTNVATVWDSQFVHCGTAVGAPNGSNVVLHNVLIVQASNCVSTTGSASAEHLTADQCQTFCPASYAGAHLTNSILTAIANTNGVSLISSVSLSNGNGVYQIVGSGSYYLTNSSIYHNFGTTNISPQVLADIRIKTTYPPVNIETNTYLILTNNLTLSPQVQRDTNAAPDLGYHYDPLDYVLCRIYATNSTITINPGTAVGICGLTNVAANANYAIGLALNARIVSQGLANNPNWIVEYNTVQEETTNTTSAPWVTALCSIVEFGNANPPCNFQFTDWSIMAQDTYHILAYNSHQVVNFQNCEVYGGQLLYYEATFNLTNCLLARVNADVEPDDSNIPVIRNNLFLGGTFSFYPSQTNCIVRDNLFDRASIPDGLWGDGVTYAGGNNAYVTNCDTLDPTYPSDVILSNSLAYQTGPLGNYYQPTNSPLINAGSTTADQVGLYHFTTQTNQVKETNSIVDIGYHYVATDAYGNPLDSNGDGIPDYLEDANGDGIYDSGDLNDWQNFLSLKILITRPRSGSSLP
jgi:hypothetical protein